MNKDFMLSEAEKQRRKARLEENRNMTLQRLSTIESTNSFSKTEPLSSTLNEIDQVGYSFLFFKLMIKLLLFVFFS